MKKTLKTMCMAAALTVCMAIPAMAAETRQEYKTEAAPIRAELKELSEKAKALREENKSVAAEYKAVRLAKKNGGTVTISKEDLAKIKTLSKEIKALKADSKETKGTLKALRTEAKDAAKAKDFNKAIDNLKKQVDIKEARVERMEKTNSLWKQIDELLN